MTPSSLGQPLPMALAAIKRQRHPFPFPLPVPLEKGKKRDGNGNGEVKVEMEGRGCRACHQSCEFYRPDVCGMWFGWIFASDHEFWPMVMGTLASTTRVYCPHDLANISACAKFVICKFYLRPFHHYSPITFGISFTLVLHILFSYFVLYQHGIIAHKWPVTH